MTVQPATESNQIDPPLAAPVVLVSAVPFWQRGTGAEQRIYSLWRFLVRRGRQVVVFYLNQLTENDLGRIPADMQVRHYRPLAEVEPRRLKDLWRRFKSLLHDQAVNGTKQNKQKPRPLVPEDFRWPGAESQFRALVEEIEPELIIVEYVALACYVEYLPAHRRKHTRVILDAHDVMHQRCERFAKCGEQNWLQIDRRQESELITRFDAVLAIQHVEANAFRQMAPEVSVIVAGHCPEHVIDVPTLAARPHKKPQTVVVGFLGSDNHPNLLGGQWFLQEVWPRVESKCAGNTALLLAGGFTLRLDTNLVKPLAGAPDRYRQLPQISDLQQFYDGVDIVVNPVTLGTGLKIKNVEALYCGKPLVTTSHSAVGLPESLMHHIQVADAAEHFAAALVTLIEDDDFRKRTADGIRRTAHSEFSESAVYASFARWLDSPRVGAKS